MFPGALPVSMNHLVGSRAPPEKVSRNVGVAELVGWPAEAGLCANAAAPRINPTARTCRNMFMALIAFWATRTVVRRPQNKTSQTHLSRGTLVEQALPRKIVHEHPTHRGKAREWPEWAIP